jgi:hypothetical protein
MMMRRYSCGIFKISVFKYLVLSGSQCYDDNNCCMMLMIVVISMIIKSNVVDPGCLKKKALDPGPRIRNTDLQ